MGQRLHVKYDAAKLSTAAIADAVADTGMRAWLEHEEPVVGSDRADARSARRSSGRRASRSAPAWRSQLVGSTPADSRAIALLRRSSLAAGVGADRAQGVERGCAPARSTSTC